MFLGELGEIPDSLVDIFFQHQIFRYASRIFQARVSPELGEAVLQGLNSTLYKNAMSWIPDKAPPRPVFRA
jgi:hypothetical protein